MGSRWPDRTDPKETTCPDLAPRAPSRSRPQDRDSRRATAHPSRRGNCRARLHRGNLASPPVYINPSSWDNACRRRRNPSRSAQHQARRSDQRSFAARRPQKALRTSSRGSSAATIPPKASKDLRADGHTLVVAWMLVHPCTRVRAGVGSPVEIRIREQAHQARTLGFLDGDRGPWRSLGGKRDGLDRTIHGMLSLPE